MLKRWIVPAWAAVLALANFALAAGAEREMKLLPSEWAIWPWVAGALLFALTLVAGFKHPGRSHLD